MGYFTGIRHVLLVLMVSGPDGASMCKHLAAALYGVGARLDHSPEMLFTLRRVDPGEMVVAAIEQGVDGKKTSRGRVLQNDDLSSVFGIDLSNDDSLEAENVLPLPKGRRGPVKKITPKKAPANSAGKENSLVQRRSYRVPQRPGNLHQKGPGWDGTGKDRSSRPRERPFRGDLGGSACL